MTDDNMPHYIPDYPYGSLDEVEIAGAAPKPKPTKPPKSTEKTEKLLKAHRPTRVHDHLDPEVAAKLRLMADKERYRHG